MNDAIEIKLTYTTEDYARIIPYVQEHALKRKYWIYIIPIGTFLGIIWLIDAMSYETDTPRYSAQIFCASVPALIMFVVVWVLDKKSRWISRVDKISPWLMNREALKLFEKNPHLSEVITVTVSDKGLKYTNASGSEQLDWVIFTRSTESSSDIFFTTVTGDVRFIPKRVFASDEQKLLFYNVIKKNLGRKADLSL